MFYNSSAVHVNSSRLSPVSESRASALLLATGLPMSLWYGTQDRPRSRFSTPPAMLGRSAF